MQRDRGSEDQRQGERSLFGTAWLRPIAQSMTIQETEVELVITLVR